MFLIIRRLNVVPSTLKYKQYISCGGTPTLFSVHAILLLDVHKQYKVRHQTMTKYSR